jgi:hypothetical protein
MRKRSSSEFVITPLGILQVDDLAETHGGDAGDTANDDVVHTPDPVTRWTRARVPEPRPKN